MLLVVACLLICLLLAVYVVCVFWTGGTPVQGTAMATTWGSMNRGLGNSGFRNDKR